MREVTTSYLDAAVEMRCGHCGAVELLPRDAQARVLALRSLAMERRWAEDAARGPAIAYLKIMEDPGPFVLPYMFGAAIATATAIATPSQWSVIPIGAIGGAAISAVVALALSRRRLRATVAPLVRAFTGSAGQARRCRRCGAELPPHGGAFVTCAYCEAANLISRDAAVERAGELTVEARDARLYAVETAETVRQAGVYVARMFRLAFVIGVGAGVGVAWLVASALR